jgi:hypothetical protein
MMERRRIIGLMAILIGTAGLTLMYVEQRNENERKRLLAAQAERFRAQQPPDDPTAVVWEGKTFRAGDRVRLAAWAGTVKPDENPARVEVDAGPGQTGVIIRGEVRRPEDQSEAGAAEPLQIVRVRWAPQRWKKNGGDWLELPEFESTVHVSYLEVVR